MDPNNPFSRPENIGPPEISETEIIYQESEDFIGEGNFGRVFKGRCRGTSVAVKVPRKQNLSINEVEDFRQEVKIMSQIFHPNVVLFMGACTQPGKIKIVTEKMETDMEHYLNSPNAKKTPLFLRLKMAKDAAKGMSWLHGINNIIHRDLKPANLLIDKNNIVKVTDFGLSEILKENKPMREGSPKGSVLWMPPEVLESTEFDKSADVYAFGLILWQIYSLQEPFQGFDDWDDFYEAVCIENQRPTIDDKCPPSLKRLIENCWDKNRLIRPSFPEIVYSLDEVLVDVAITEPSGIDFWKKFYLVPKQELLETVNWQDLTMALCESTGIKPDQYHQFEILFPYLASPGESFTNGKVTLNSFNTAINWFGAEFLLNSKKALEKIRILVSKEWFHGTIDQTEANGRLVLEKNGSFLVRLSKTLAEFPFTLSLNLNGQQRHLRIKKDKDLMSGSDVFLVAGHDNAYINLIELIEGISEPLGLKSACSKKPAVDMYSGKVEDLLVNFQ